MRVYSPVTNKPIGRGLQISKNLPLGIKTNKIRIKDHGEEDIMILEFGVDAS